MATRCCVCRHPERQKIEALVAGGQRQKAVAKRFNIDNSALSRHMNGTPTTPPHVTRAELSVYLCGAADVQKLRLIAAEQNGTILEDLQLVKAMTFRQLADAANVKDATKFASLAGRFLDILESLGQRTGEIARINPGITVNQTNIVAITATPQFVRLQRGLMRLCLDHPELRPDIAAMLKECEDEESRGELVALEALRDAA